MSVLLLGYPEDTVTDEQLTQIREIAPDMEIVITDDDEIVAQHLNNIEIVVRRVKHDQLLKMPNLRWFQQWGAGADWLMRYPQAQEKDFIFTNASGIHPIQISEHILAFMLAFARKFPTAYKAQSVKQWTISDDELGLAPPSSIFELAGQTVLMVGVGAIGARTAKLCDAFGMTVIGVRRNPQKTSPSIERMVAPHQLIEVLPKADWVIITAPLTPETRGMFDAATFKAMKPSAYIVNIGRGSIIVEDDMIAALQNGEIAGVGLDVVDEEPLSAESPLWEMHNVILTAHYSGATPHYDERAFEIFIDNLRRYKNGNPLRNVVNKRLAY